MGPHAAAMGLKFYTGTMFPQEYRNQMFIVRKGSWNRNTPSGFDIVTVKAGADGKDATMTPFLTGFNQSSDRYDFWGRPAYVQQMPDGALLVSRGERRRGRLVAGNGADRRGPARVPGRRSRRRSYRRSLHRGQDSRSADFR